MVAIIFIVKMFYYLNIIDLIKYVIRRRIIYNNKNKIILFIRKNSIFLIGANNNKIGANETYYLDLGTCHNCIFMKVHTILSCVTFVQYNQNQK